MAASKKKATGQELVDYIKRMSPDEKAAYYKNVVAKAKEARLRNKALKEEALKKAQEILPEVLARDIIQSDNESWQPDSALLNRLHALTQKGLTLDQLRQGPFRQLSERTWSKITKYLFKDQRNNIEDLGLTVLNAEKKALSKLARMARMIRKEIKQYTKAGKRPPPKLFDTLAATERLEMDMSLRVSKLLHDVGAVGEKSKTATIHIHTATPRPQRLEKVVEAVVSGKESA